MLFILLLAIPGAASAQDADNNIYLPLVTVKPCTEAELESLRNWDGKTNAEPDYESKAGCQLPVVGAPLDQPRGVAPMSEVESADLFTTNKYAKQNLNCTTCTTSNGVALVRTIHSAKEPYITAGNWSNYWWGNGTSVFNNTLVTCQNGVQLYQQAGMGIGKGRLTSSINLNQPMLYSVVARPGYCYGFTTYQAVLPNAALTMEMYRESNGTWTARAWFDRGTTSLPMIRHSVGQHKGSRPDKRLEPQTQTLPILRFQ